MGIHRLFEWVDNPHLIVSFTYRWLQQVVETR